MNEDNEDSVWTIKTYINNSKIDDRNCYLIYNNNIIIGAVDICNADNEYFYIENFNILKQYRNNGYGKIAFKEIINLIKNSNINKIRLLVKKDNKIAIHIYELNGFEIIGIKNQFFIMELSI